MELEEMKTVWSEISDQLEKQKKLNTKIIIMMTQEKYQNKWKKIKTPELVGAIICYAAAVFILFNFQKLGNWYNMVSGILTLVILLVLPILSLQSIWKMSSINFAQKSCKDTLIEFAKRKKNFKNFQQINYVLSFILMFLILPVTTKLLNNKDFFTDVRFSWVLPLSLVVAIVFLIFFIRWAHKCTQKNIREAENIIQDLESNA